jgi:hypothetical protein
MNSGPKDSSLFIMRRKGINQSQKHPVSRSGNQSPAKLHKAINVKLMKTCFFYRK